MAVLAIKCEVCFRMNADALLKKQYVFHRIVIGDESVLKATKNVFFYKLYCIILICFTQI